MRLAAFVLETNSDVSQVMELDRLNYVVGNNGSGKSNLLRSVMDLDAPILHDHDSVSDSGRHRSQLVNELLDIRGHRDTSILSFYECDDNEEFSDQFVFNSDDYIEIQNAFFDQRDTGASVPIRFKLDALLDEVVSILGFQDWVVWFAALCQRERVISQLTERNHEGTFVPLRNPKADIKTLETLIKTSKLFVAHDGSRDPWLYLACSEQEARLLLDLADHRFVDQQLSADLFASSTPIAMRILGCQNFDALPWSEIAEKITAAEAGEDVGPYQINRRLKREHSLLASRSRHSDGESNRQIPPVVKTGDRILIPIRCLGPARLNVRTIFADSKVGDTTAGFEEMCRTLAFRMSDEFGIYASNAWLVPLEGDTNNANRFEINPLFSWCATQILALVNEQLPSFVSSRWRYAVSFEPPVNTSESFFSEWMIASDSEFKIKPDALGSGVARWFKLTFQLVANALNNLDISVSGKIDPGSIDLNVSDLDKMSVAFERSERHILVVDEPEANTHPGALADIDRWLQKQSENVGVVVIATHSPRLFDTGASECSRFLSVRPISDVPPMIRKIGGPLSGDQDALVELGLTPSEVFLLTRRWLIVEGEADRAVVEVWFGPQLKSRGVSVISARGSGNLSNLMAIEVVAMSGKDMTVLLDKEAPGSHDITSELREKISNGVFASDIKRAMSKFGGGKGPIARLGVASLDVIDIWGLLDRDLIIEVLIENGGNPTELSKFPGWAVAEANYFATNTNASTTNFKKYLWREFGLALKLPDVEEIARRQRKANRVPVEIEDLVLKSTESDFGDLL